MVRIARLSWTDAGPLFAGEGRDWLGEDEADEVPETASKRRRPRHKRSRTSPIDRRPAANAPPDGGRDAA